MGSARVVAYTKPTRVMTMMETDPVINDGPLTIGELIAYCARVSNPGNQANHETAPRLLKYLVSHRHWSPFEMASITMELKTTRDIARQVLRHRSFSFQEFSQRYGAVQEDAVLREVRLQDPKNRQGSLQASDVDLSDWWMGKQGYLERTATAIYQAALARGVAKEVARTVLPEGLTPSTLYMAGTVRSWIHYVQERTADGVQLEHRELAGQARDCLLGLVPELEEVLA